MYLQITTASNTNKIAKSRTTPSTGQKTSWMIPAPLITIFPSVVVVPPDLSLSVVDDRVVVVSPDVVVSGSLSSPSVVVGRAVMPPPDIVTSAIK